MRRDVKKLMKKTAIIISASMLLCACNKAETSDTTAKSSENTKSEETTESKEPAVYEAESKNITYDSRGVKVPATIVTPKGLDKYPVAVLIHGHGGSREEGSGYALVAEKLAVAGVGSIRMDFAGCGESTESFQNNTLTNMKADVSAAIEYVKAEMPVTKLGMFGYSMGGRITLEMLAEGQNLMQLLS